MTRIEIEEALQAAEKLADYMFSIGKFSAGNELLGAIGRVDMDLEGVNTGEAE